MLSLVSKRVLRLAPIKNRLQTTTKKSTYSPSKCIASRKIKSHSIKTLYRLYSTKNDINANLSKNAQNDSKSSISVSEPSGSSNLPEPASKQSSTFELYSQLKKFTADCKQFEAETVFSELISLNPTSSWSSVLFNYKPRDSQTESVDDIDLFLEAESEAYRSKSGLEPKMRHNLSSNSINPLSLYNMMLEMYRKLNNIDKFFELLFQMESSGIQVNMETYRIFLQLRANRNEIQEMLTLATEMIQSNIRLDVNCFNILIEAVGNKGWEMIPVTGHFGGLSGVATASQLFSFMSRLKTKKNTYTYEYMIKALYNVDLCEDVIQCFDDMRERGIKVNAEICATVMKAFYRIGQPKDALSIWKNEEKLILDYLHNMEANSTIESSAKPRIWAQNESPTTYANSNTEAIVIDIYKEMDRFDECFKVWHLFRRANVPPSPNTCAALMEIYFQLGDFVSGSNVHEWMEYVHVKPSSRSLDIYINILTQSDISETIKQEKVKNAWKALRKADPNYLPKLVSTFEASMISFYSSHEYREVLDVFKVMYQSLIAGQSESSTQAFNNVKASNDPENPTENTKNQTYVIKDTSETIRKPLHNDKRPKNRMKSPRHSPATSGVLTLSMLLMAMESALKSDFLHSDLVKISEQVEALRAKFSIQKTPQFDSLFAECITVKIAPEPLILMSKHKVSVRLGGMSMFTSPRKIPAAPKFVPTNWNIDAPTVAATPILEE